MRLLLFFLIVLAALPAWAGQTPSAPPAAPAQQTTQPRRGRMNTREFLGLGREPEKESAARGAKLYGPACGFCHGPAARGAEGPNLVRSTIVLHDDKGEVIGPIIRGGRPGTPMPAFPAFTPEELHDIAEFLHMQVELAVNRSTYKPLNVVTGDPKAGQSFFSGDGKCTTCHSVTGDLAHVGAKYEPADLQAAILYPAARGSDAAAPQATITLPSGKTLTGKIKHLDDFYVSFYDAAGNYQSVNLEKGVKVDVEDKLIAHRRMLDQMNDTRMHDLAAYLVTLK
ncbi:MAG TPA: c-type cytochrome [Bryobacteraceae bacterium]|nr:c-type cytochrome [Bryobacteraceae bacterium]